MRETPNRPTPLFNIGVLILGPDQHSSFALQMARPSRWANDQENGCPLSSERRRDSVVNKYFQAKNFDTPVKCVLFLLYSRTIKIYSFMLPYL